MAFNNLSEPPEYSECIDEQLDSICDDMNSEIKNWLNKLNCETLTELTESEQQRFRGKALAHIMDESFITIQELKDCDDVWDLLDQIIVACILIYEVGCHLNDVLIYIKYPFEMDCSKEVEKMLADNEEARAENIIYN